MHSLHFWLSILHIALRTKDKIVLHPSLEVRGLSIHYGFEEAQKVDHLTERILSKYLYQRNPDWVGLYSPYRTNQDQITLHDVHLSMWFDTHL